MPELTFQQLIDELNRCLTTLRNSTATYLSNSNPYVADRDKDAQRAIGEITSVEHQFADRMTALIESMDGVPQVGLTDPALAELNYLSFPFILDVLIRDKEKEVALYERRLESVGDFPKTNALLQEILEEHQTHLKKLQTIRSNRYPSGDEESAA